MKRAFDSLGAAFAYFSIVPVGRFARGGRPDGGVLAALPVVGAVLGVAAGLGARGALAAGATPALAASIAFTIDVVGSGAIHLDGYLDCCDALFAPVEPARRHEILKDPRHGSFALAGMAVATSLWCASLAQLAERDPAGMPATLGLAGATGRLAAVASAAAFPYGFPAQKSPERPGSFALGLAFAAVVFGARARDGRSAAFALAALGGGHLAARAASRRLGGGLTGDAYGFVAVVVQVAMLTAMAFA